MMSELLKATGRKSSYWAIFWNELKKKQTWKRWFFLGDKE